MAQVVFETFCSFCAVHRIICCGNPIAKFPPRHRKTQHSYGDDCHWSAVSQPGIDCNHVNANILPDYRKNSALLVTEVRQYHHLGPQIDQKLKKKALTTSAFFLNQSFFLKNSPGVEQLD